MGVPAPAGFKVVPVRNRTVGGLVGARTLGMVLHVQAGNGALSGWFNNPTAQASSTWWAGKAGGREQYGNPDTDKFWAQAAGNSTYHSIETEGQPSEPLTAAQIESCAVAYAFGHVRYGWPFRLAEKPGQRGLGWHGMGGSAWGGHTGCPGDKRKAQRTEILRRAKALVEGDDMPITTEDASKIWTTDLTRKGTIGDAKANESPLDILTRVARNVEYTANLVKAVGRAVDDKAAFADAVAAKLPAGTAVDKATLTAAFVDALTQLANQES